ncbi:MAG: glucose-6-phosphate isomerase [Planctomycetaceae bacterium]
MIQYDASAAEKLLTKQKPADIKTDLLAARQEVLEDLRIYNSEAEVPSTKEPLDSGFIEYPQRLLAGEFADHSIDQIETIAGNLRDRVDSVVSLGIGGSYMGAKALFDALCHRCHNELPKDRRSGPRIYFEGHNVDNDKQVELLELLESRDENWGIVVISKSGGTLETAAAFRVFHEALAKKSSSEVAHQVAPVTGAAGKLRSLASAIGVNDESILPVPEGIGGRFSILTPVGLLPAAIMGLDIRQLLQGAADMTKRFFESDPGDNPVLDFVAVCRLFEANEGMPLRILSTWGDRLEAVGLWYDQLLAESLGKEEQGPTPLTVVNTRDLHSRGQQHQEGARDRIITNVRVGSINKPAVTMPELPDSLNHDQLNKYAGTAMETIQKAAFDGTNKAYADDRRPTADITLPELNEYALGELFQMLMLATVVEGRLTGINPYGQPGVEAYKQNMTAILNG